MAKVTFRTDLCKGCGLCVNACPKGLLAIAAEQINAKAVELILEDQYDFVVVYNGNYDSVLHDFGPEDVRTLAELRVNDSAFGMFSNMIRQHWKHHDTLMAFAMDHGCHHTEDGRGGHGNDSDEDMNIVHHYQIYPRG